MKKKGFTLIELLAVIMVLAIIALISTPIILKVIEKAERGSFEDSAYGILDAARLYYADINLDEKGKEETFTFPEDNKLKLSGKKPATGKVVLDEDGKIELAISNGKWCAIKEKEKEKIKVVDYSIGDCVIGEEKPQTPESCFEVNDSGDTITNYTCADTDVVIPNKINGKVITKVGGAAFRYQLVTSVVIPDSVTIIEVNAFAQSQLQSVNIPPSVTTIENSAFMSCNLTSVKIPNTVTIIGDNAFSSNQLVYIEIPEGVTTIGESAFNHNQLSNIKLPNSITKMGYAAFNDNQLADNKAFIYGRNNDGTENKQFIVSYGGAKRNDIIIPDTVTVIGDLAFASNQLASVNISKGVIEIRASAFAGNKLTNITIPDTVRNIYASAFSQNELESLTIPKSVERIDTRAFERNKLINVDISNGLTIIGASAFMSNNLTSITIPSSVTSIGNDAFRANDSSMKVIINKSNGSIKGSPWGAASVEWTG